jgi:nitrogen fixation protein NifU and related proteins
VYQAKMLATGMAMCALCAVPDKDEIYPEHIRRHCDDPYHRGRSASCTHAHEDIGSLCGDTIRLELQIDDQGTLRQVYFDGNGCCISQAAASMLAQRFDGQHIGDIRKFSRQDMLDLLGIPLGRKRQNCGLLAWRVMRIAVDSPVALRR